MPSILYTFLPLLCKHLSRRAACAKAWLSSCQRLAHGRSYFWRPTEIHSGIKSRAPLRWLPAVEIALWKRRVGRDQIVSRNLGKVGLHGDKIQRSLDTHRPHNPFSRMRILARVVSTLPHVSDVGVCTVHNRHFLVSGRVSRLHRGMHQRQRQCTSATDSVRS